MPNKIEPVPMGIITDKTHANTPDTNNIKAFPADSPIYRKKEFSTYRNQDFVRCCIVGIFAVTPIILILYIALF